MPEYIKKEIISFDIQLDKLGVTFIVSPTVPNAEKISNNICFKENFSKAHSIKADKSAVVIYNTVIECCKLIDNNELESTYLKYKDMVNSLAAKYLK